MGQREGTILPLEVFSGEGVGRRCGPKWQSHFAPVRLKMGVGGWGRDLR